MSERSDKLGLESRISTVFTMLLTAMSVMRVAKTFLELGIDSLLIRRAERTQSELPADVARRKVILEEKFITTALAGARAEGGGGGGKGLAAGSSSRARRLSEIGRCLSSKGTSVAAAEETGVEMTSLAVHENPMSNRSGGAATRVDGAAEAAAAAAKSAHAESPTRQEFELQQRRIEEQERRIEEQQRCNEEQQRQIDNLIKMVSSLGEGLPAIGADILKGTVVVDNIPPRTIAPILVLIQIL